VTKDVIVQSLEKLNKMQVLTYLPQKKLPQIIFAIERMDMKDFTLSKEHYQDRKNDAIKRIEAVRKYVTSTNKCRSSMLLDYFGEKESTRCGKCDVCMERNKLELSDYEFEFVLNQIKPLLLQKACALEEVITTVKDAGEDMVIKVIQWLFDNDKITYDENNLLKWHS